MIRALRLVMPVVLLIGLAVPRVKADDITFTGGAGGTVGIVDNLITGAHEFVLSNGPLNTLTINGTSISFSGVLNIDATGTTTDSSGDLLFTSGTLTITSGGNTEVLGSLLEGELATVNGVDTFLGVLDPSATTFGDLLSGEGPLALGLGATQFGIVLPIISLPDVGGLGIGTESAVALVTTPEASALLLVGVGLAGIIFKKLLS